MVQAERPMYAISTRLTMNDGRAEAGGKPSSLRSWSPSGFFALHFWQACHDEDLQQKQHGKRWAQTRQGVTRRLQVAHKREMVEGARCICSCCAIA